MDEKDRLGDKLRDVERGREDQYFAQRDRELLDKIKQAQAGQAEDTLKQAALMRCPKCGERLAERRLHDVVVDECRACQGIWLDHGELIRVARLESEGWIARWLRSLTEG
ncbi:MAG: zf-TFIIB domain-containing protein [Deltaproteobacteria bacterium]|nr:zf-TFIIB domain-containing protein [Deltaproteobacteria bacterium]